MLSNLQNRALICLSTLVVSLFVGLFLGQFAFLPWPAIAAGLPQQPSRYQPKAQANAHGALHALWEGSTPRATRFQCADIHSTDLRMRRTNHPKDRDASRTSVGFTADAEQLLTQLIGNRLPDTIVGTSEKSVFIQWGQNAPLSSYHRRVITGRIYQLQQSFARNKGEFYSFAYAVRGQKAIDDYLNFVKEKYEASYERFLTESRRRLEEYPSQKINSVQKSLILGGLATAGSFAAQSMGLIPDPTLPLLTGLGTAGWALVNSFPILIGGFLYPRVFRDFSSGPSRLSDLIQAWNSGTQLSGGIYTENRVVILTSAFNALKAGTENVTEEMLRSCIAFSPSCRGQEAPALMIGMDFDRQGIWNGLMQIILQGIDAGHDSELIEGRVVTTIFWNEALREPVLLNWISFDRFPPEDSGKPPSPPKVREPRRIPVWGPLPEPAGG